MQALVRSVLDGNRRGVARAITVVERGGSRAAALTDALWPHGGRAVRIGVTGPPGSGKSTLVDHLASDQDGGAAILAVDPSSPFSHGALLGDRIRMERAAMDDGVFLRSMANRGRLGGIAPSTWAAADVLDAGGYATIFVETVGVGQSEIDVATGVDLTMLVLGPGAGDGVQALKAGVIEIADVFVINKSDLDGAARLEAEIASALELRPGGVEGAPPVVQVSALNGDGVDDLMSRVAGILADRGEVETTRRRREVTRRRIEGLLGERLAERARDLAASDDVIARVHERREGPNEAVERWLDRVTGDGE